MRELIFSFPTEMGRCSLLRTALGQIEAFPLPTLDARFEVSNLTFAGPRGTCRIAPVLAVRVTAMEPLGIKILRPVDEHVFLDLSAQSEAIFVPARAIRPCDPEQVFLFEVCNPDLWPRCRGAA